jgi:malonyl CoA-acyl carrier protein transacylase
MNVAFLFPGQGSQVPGMLHALPDHPTISRTLDEVSETLKQNVLQLDSPEALRSTIRPSPSPARAVGFRSTTLCVRRSLGSP